MPSRHDAHFLTRIQRLESEHAELALALYHDSELVRFVLSKVELADAVERVAISLGDPERGPFIIVARDGGFVTCLGVGMRPGDDKPLITRRQLDAISGRVDGLRRAMSEAESSMSHTRRLLRRVLEAGDRLTREEFEQLSRLTPLLAGHYFHALVDEVNTSLTCYERLERARRLTAPRHAKVLRLYWSSSWAMAHFSLLLAADGPAVFGELFERLQQIAPEVASRRGQLLPWALTRLGVTSFAARGAWVASKISKVLLSDLKLGWVEANSPNTTLGHGLGLAAIGLRHRRLRAEVRKALARPGAPSNDPVVPALRQVLTASYEASCEAPEPLRETLPELARELMQKMGEQLGPEQAEACAALPDEVAVAVLLAMPLGIHDVNPLLHLLGWLPWLVTAEAQDFYMPEAHMSFDKWTPREGIVLIEPRRKHDHPRGVTSVDPSKPRRKGPCPCGSGKKYKRCCGVGSRSDDETSVELEPLDDADDPLLLTTS